MVLVSLSELIAGAKSGEAVCFLTDTVPALATIPDAAAKIYQLKGRPITKPLILMAARAGDLWKFVQGTEAEFAAWQQVANNYWPGALTLVLPASDAVPDTVKPPEIVTVGLRVPNQQIAQTVLAATGPLATTSVNLSGEPPLETPEAISSAFPQLLTLDWQKEQQSQTNLGIPSTIIRWQGEGWQVIRQGAVTI